MTGGWGKDSISGGAGDDVLKGDGAAQFTVPLTITSALTDTDGSETLSIKIANVPSDGVLSAGTKNADGTWTLTSAQLSGLTLTTSAGTNFALNVTATTTEASNGALATKTGTINVTVPSGSGDADTIDGGIGNDQITGGKGNDTLTGGSGDDTYIFNKGDGQDTITDASGADTVKLGSGIVKTDVAYNQVGNDLVITIAGGDQMTVKNHFATSTVESLVFSDGSKVALNNLINQAPVLKAQTFSGTEDQAIVGSLGATDANGDALTYTLLTGPANGTLSLNSTTGAFTFNGAKDWSGSNSFTVKVADGRGGEATQTMTVNVAAVADTPTVSAASVSLPATSGVRSVALDIKGALTDTDGSETLAFKIESLPSDAVLSAGTKNADNSWSLTAADLSGLSLTTGATTDFTVQVTAIATETSNGAKAYASANFNVAAPQPGTVLPNLFMGYEDQNITGAVSTTGLSGSGFTFSIADAADHGVATINSSTGQFTYKGSSNWSGLDKFAVEIKNSSGVTTTKTINLDVAGIADAPTVAAKNLTVPLQHLTLNGTTKDDTLKGGVGNDTITGGDGKDTIYGDAVTPFTIALDLSTALADADGSESLRVRFSSLPPGATLSAGQAAYEAGSWWVEGKDLSGLKMTAASATDFSVIVTAFAVEKSSSDLATATTSFTVHVPDGDGNDMLDGGAGNDTIYGGVGNDTITGGLGDDILFGDAGNDTLKGGDGKDRLTGGTGDDLLESGTGDDSIYAEDGDDTAFGGDGKDQVLGGKGDDTLYGEAGDDKIDGGEGDDLLKGGLGNDTLVGGAGTDVVHGEDGNDLAYGGSGDDLLLGGGGADLLYGESGDDVIHGGDGNNLMNGGSGNDLIYGGIDNDRVFSGEGDDIVYTGAGIDTVVGGLGDDEVHGEAGNDAIDGGDGNDVLDGDDGADSVKGGNGDDYVDGGTGNDKLEGGEGNDFFVTKDGDGTDTFAGGGGFDTIDFSALSSAISVNLAKGTATQGAVIDKVATIEKVIGTGFNDTLIGSAVSDELVGGAGNDTIQGGNGSDTLTGGAGNDKFVWAVADLGTAKARPLDVVKDFDVDDDTLDFRLLSAGQTFVNRWDAVQARETDEGTVLAVQVKGVGFVDVVMLEGIHGMTPEALHQASCMLV
jgi:Ca2+-binding RTX toxin-like protein